MVKFPALTKKIINWYSQHKRDLPWRNTQDPYKIWLSEIILQQTRVAQGLPYYEKFVNTLPTIEDFAKAEIDLVLRLWQGLGYYSRARNMYETAQMIMNDYGGKFPTTYKDLLKLKGIGSYTAAAIASFAFNEPVAAIDGNVFRVLSRLFGIETDILSTQAKKVFGEIAQEMLDETQADIFNQAMMEFGAMQCTPANPNCMFCPVSLECYANQTQAQAKFPVKEKKLKIKNRYLTYFVVEVDKQILMKQRKEKDIWTGLFDFYLLESATPLEDLTEVEDIFLQTLFAEAKHIGFDKALTHQLTHQKLYVKFWRVELEKLPVELPLGYQFYSIDEIEHLAKPILIENYLKLKNPLKLLHP